MASGDQMHPVELLQRVRATMQRDLATMQDPEKAYSHVSEDLTRLAAATDRMRASEPLVGELVDTLRTLLTAHARLAESHAKLRGGQDSDDLQPSSDAVAASQGIIRAGGRANPPGPLSGPSRAE